MEDETKSASYPEVVLPKVRCKRCGHEWTPRKKKVFQCPNCKNPRWDQDREEDTNATPFKPMYDTKRGQT